MRTITKYFGIKHFLFPFLSWNKPFWAQLVGAAIGAFSGGGGGGSSASSSAGGGWGAVIGNAAGTYLASESQEDAAETTAQGTESSLDLLRNQALKNEENLGPFIKGSAPAYELQQALSGALGPEAQEEAYANYSESPGVAFMRERGLRGIDRNAAARGDLVGGNTDKARIKFSQGMAEQDFNNYFNRLGAITGTGLSAANALAGVQSASATGQAQLTQQGAYDQANIGMERGRTLASGLEGFASGVGEIYANRNQNK